MAAYMTLWKTLYSFYPGCFKWFIKADPFKQFQSAFFKLLVNTEYFILGGLLFHKKLTVIFLNSSNNSRQTVSKRNTFTYLFKATAYKFWSISCTKHMYQDQKQTHLSIRFRHGNKLLTIHQAIRRKSVFICLRKVWYETGSWGAFDLVKFSVWKWTSHNSSSN